MKPPIGNLPFIGSSLIAANEDSKMQATAGYDQSLSGLHLFKVQFSRTPIVQFQDIEEAFFLWINII